MRIEAKIKAISPIFVGGETSGTIRLPYMIHVPHDKKKYTLKKELVEDLIRATGGFYRTCDKNKFGKRSFTEAFRDRVYAALCTSTISQFFSNLIRYLPTAEETFYQYMAKFSAGLSKEENIFLLQWARENIDMFVAVSIYLVESYKFKEEFELSDDMLGIESDYLAPVLPGNTIRGLMRDQIMSYVIRKVYDENPNKCLTAKQYHTLFSGGMLTSASGFVDIESKRLFRSKMPFLSILGSMIGNEDLPGKIKVGFAKLDCNEFNSKNERSGHSYLKEYFMTRNDNYEGEIDEKFKEEIKNTTVQMYYSILAIETGAEFDWVIESFHLSDEEKMFFDLMLELFKKNGYVGGLSRAGYGKILVEYQNYKPDFSGVDDFLESNKEEIKTIIGGI